MPQLCDPDRVIALDGGLFASRKIRLRFVCVYAHIVGWGKYLPERIVDNDEIANIVDTSDEWIRARTGIGARRVAAKEETTASLAFEAAVRALNVAGMLPSQLDLVVVATSTPDHMYPSTASLVQDQLGAVKAGAFDLSAACSGFVYALTMASNAIQTGSINTAVVIGSETTSRVLDWSDRGTCIIFGDGAGAVVLQGSDVPGGILASTLRSDGSGGDLLQLPTAHRTPMPVIGTRWNGQAPMQSVITMNGRQVFRFATRVIANSIEDTLAKAELTVDDVSLIVPHQANTRIIDSAAKKLKISPEQFYMNIESVGNTSAASIPIALVDAVADRRLKPNDNVVFIGFGGGLTWATAVIKWAAQPVELTDWQRRWRSARYIFASIRSRYRQIARRLGARLGGSPTPDARLRDADKRD